MCLNGNCHDDKINYCGVFTEYCRGKTTPVPQTVRGHGRHSPSHLPLPLGCSCRGRFNADTIDTPRGILGKHHTHQPPRHLPCPTGLLLYSPGPGTSNRSADHRTASGKGRCYLAWFPAMVAKTLGMAQHIMPSDYI